MRDNILHEWISIKFAKRGTGKVEGLKQMAHSAIDCGHYDNAISILYELIAFIEEVGYND